MADLVSVIVPACNNEGTLHACLCALARQGWPHLEILVVNDGSTDGTGAVARRHAARDGRIRVLDLPVRRGAAAARNVGLHHAQGALLAFTDGDCEPEPQWLERLLVPVLADSEACAGGPDVVPADAPLISRCIGHSVDSWVTSAGLRRGETTLVNYLPGTGNLALRRTMLERVGTFNEAFHDTGEDKEFLYRARAAGARMVHVKDARVWHRRKPSITLHAWKMFRYGVRRVDLWRAGQPFEAPHLAPVLLWVLLLAALLPDPVLGPLARWATAAGAGLLLADALHGALALRDLRALLVLPVTSAAVPLGYGLGILAGLGSRARAATPARR